MCIVGHDSFRADANFMQFHGEATELGWRIEGFWPDPSKPTIPELLPPDVERIYIQAESVIFRQSEMKRLRQQCMERL